MKKYIQGKPNLANLKGQVNYVEPVDLVDPGDLTKVSEIWDN